VVLDGQTPQSLGHDEVLQFEAVQQHFRAVAAELQRSTRRTATTQRSSMATQLQ